MSELTELEKELIKTINWIDNPEYFFASEIFDTCKMDSKKARGVLGSLVKKGIIEIDNFSDGLITIYKPELFDFQNG